MTKDQLLRLECARVAGGNEDMARKIYNFIMEGKDKIVVGAFYSKKSKNRAK